MIEERGGGPAIHFLNIGGLDLGPLCELETQKRERPTVTALIEQVTCPDCIRMLNTMLAGALNNRRRSR